MSVASEKRQGSLFNVPVLAAGRFKSPAGRCRIFREKVLPSLWAIREQLVKL